MNARGAGGGSAGGAICSGNSDGFGGIGRIVTSSIIGSTAAATAAWAAASIDAWVCCGAGAALAGGVRLHSRLAPLGDEARLLLLGPQLIGAKLLRELRDAGPRARSTAAAAAAWSMPVATTETRMMPSRLSSKVAPTMMLAS